MAEQIVLATPPLLQTIGANAQFAIQPDDENMHMLTIAFIKAIVHVEIVLHDDDAQALLTLMKQWEAARYPVF